MCGYRTIALVAEHQVTDPEGGMNVSASTFLRPPEAAERLVELQGMAVLQRNFGVSVIIR